MSLCSANDLFYLQFSKQVFYKIPDFIHLNLSIALLLGLIVFVSGIETATRYRVSIDVFSVYLYNTLYRLAV